jgi:hypothetical protein
MNITPLTKRVQIYVPSTIKGNIPAPERQVQWVDNALVELSKMFGGATAVDAIGAYVSPDKGLIKEKIVIVFAACTAEDMLAKRAEVLAFALSMCRNMEQECVAVEFGGDMFFVSLDNAAALRDAA